MNGTDYLSRLRQKNEKICAKPELHKVQKDFTQFMQFPPGAKKVVFLGAEKPVAGVLTAAEPPPTTPSPPIQAPAPPAPPAPPPTIQATPEEAHLLDWLARSGEEYPGVVVDLCQRDPEAKEYFLRMAGPMPTCGDCRHRSTLGGTIRPGYCGGRSDLPPAYGQGHPLRLLPADGGRGCALFSART